MLSAETLEELQEYADSGRLGHQISLALTPPRPRLGSLARLEWDFTHLGEPAGTLFVPDGGRTQIPAAGYRDIRVDRDPLVLRVVAGAEEALLEVEPIVIRPRIDRLQAPPRGALGEPLDLAWRVLDAQTCRIEVAEGGQLWDRVVEPNGHLQIIPRHMGPMHIRLRSFSRDAAVSQRAYTIAEQRVEIDAPPVRIDIPFTERRIEIGGETEFHWCVSGAQEVRLRVAGQKEAVVPPHGSLFIEAGIDAENIELVAVGLDGHRHIRAMRLIPKLMSDFDIADELTILNMPWR